MSCVLLSPGGAESQDEAQAPPSPPPVPAQSEQEPVRGQTTAIVTGIVSIAFGVRQCCPASKAASIRCVLLLAVLCFSFAAHSFGWLAGPIFGARPAFGLKGRRAATSAARGIWPVI